VGKFKTEDEAVALANDTTYGLGAGLHSSTFSHSPIFFRSHFIQLQDDANQCMRVSSALEAGTVSGEHIHTASCLISSNGSVFNPTGMGKPIQYVEQQCSVWRKEAIRYRYVFLDIPVPFPPTNGVGWKGKFCSIGSHNILAGRELGSYALEEYTSVKAVHWNFGEKLEWPL
jgi:aldehyde dehydrogenase (NAD+)